jgi:hypothetical protein
LIKCKWECYFWSFTAYFFRILEKIIEKVNRKIKEYKRNNKYEVTLSQILTVTQLTLLAKQFKYLDRKVYLSKSSITETGHGKNRKWCLTSDSFLDLKEFPRPIDLTVSEDDLQTDEIDADSIDIDHQLPGLDIQDAIEDQLHKLITKLLIEKYPSSLQSRVEVLFNVVEKYLGDSNPEINVDLARESTLPQETILKLMRLIIKDLLEIQRATIGETKMLTKQRINKIAQLKISLTHLEDQEKNEIQTLEKLHRGLYQPKETFAYWKRDQTVCYSILSPKDISRLRFQMHVCCLFWNELLHLTQLKSRRIRVALESIDGLTKYGKEVRLREYEEWLKEFLDPPASRERSTKNLPLHFSTSSSNNIQMVR